MARRELQNKVSNLGALNANFDVNVSNLDNAALFIAGTFVGTVTFYGSDDGTNFVPLFGTPFDSDTAVGTATASGKGYKFGVEPLKILRASMTAYTSGTANLRAAGYTRGV